MDTAVNQVPTIAGTPFEGGFYVGRFNMAGMVFALIVASKSAGEHKVAAWNGSAKSVEGAQSFFDGYDNTRAMAEAGSSLGKWALDLDIGGYKDWYLAARDEQELCYRHLKPGTIENYCSFRDGDNPSSVPVGYPYTSDLPAQTIAEAFRVGGAEAFEQAYYWSSTQYAPLPGSAWSQGFAGGDQDYDLKSLKFRARAVRRVKI